MAMSLEDLLGKEGFKGRRSKTMSRTYSGSEAGNIPIYASRDQRKSGYSSNLSKTGRRNSDIAHYNFRGESPTLTKGKDSGPQNSLVRREKADRGLNKGTREKLVKRDSSDLRDVSSSSFGSPGYFSGNEIVEVQEGDGRVKAGTKDNGRYRDVYQNEAYSPALRKSKHYGGTGDRERYGMNSSKDTQSHKRNGNGSNKNLLGRTSSNETYYKSAKEPDASSSRSNRSSNNSKSFDQSSKNRRRVEIAQSIGEPALDDAAIKALISILSGYIKRFLKDEDFRTSLRHNCFASLNFSELEGLTESNVINKLEQAIETVERAAEECASAKELKKASLHLSVITGLSANDLKDGFTSGISNSKLAACGHLYLSVVYKLQKKDRIAAKHLLQVFCDSPFQARTMLLPELWDNILQPHLSHLEAWYIQEADSLTDTPSKARKLKQLKKVYDEILDSGTYQVAVYYKDWLTERVEAPLVPSICIPSISVQAIQHRDLNNHSSDLGSPPPIPFSPQPMVSKKLYESVFGRLHKPGAVEFDDYRETENFDHSIRSSDGSVVEDKRTLTYSLEAVKNKDPDRERDGASPSQYGVIAEDAQRLHRSNAFGERDENEKFGNSLLWEESNNGHKLDALPIAKVNELTLKRLAKYAFEMQQTEEPAELIESILLPNYDDAADLEFSPIETRSVGEGKYVDGAHIFPSIPLDYICPLTGLVFKDPVTLETGETYERVAITEWFNTGSYTCPVTRKTLECQAIPVTNFILKRIIDRWKSEHCRTILASASQVAGTSRGQRFKDEAAVIILDNLFTVFDEEEKLTQANYLIALGGLQFLIRRFRCGDLDEKTCVVALLSCCVEADSGCRKAIARNIDKHGLFALLQCKQVKARANAVLLLFDLICLNRRKDASFFLNGLQKDGIVSGMHVLLVFLQSTSPEQRPLVAVLLLTLDLLVEPRKYSIYREEAVNAISEALSSSLSNEKVRETCCRALLILGGRISFCGKVMTEDWILKQAGFLDGPDSEVLENEDEKATAGVNTPLGSKDRGRLKSNLTTNSFFNWDQYILDAGEEEAMEDWLMKVSTSLLVDGKKSFLEPLAMCLGSGDVDLVRVCLTTVAWLSSALALLPDVEFQLSAFSALIGGLKGNLENGSRVEHKILTSTSLLNFSKIPECRALLMEIVEEIAISLQRLSEATWTAKELYTTISQEDM